MILLIIFFSLQARSQTALPIISQFQDLQSAGWAYKTDDQAFEMKEPRCHVKWNVETPKPPRSSHTIVVREDCPGNLSRAQLFNQSLFQAVSAKYPKEKLATVIAHSWCARPEWKERMAVAGIKDLFSQSRKATASDFKRIFNTGAVALEESDFFAAHGLEFSLLSTEKVLLKPFNKFDFSKKYPEFSSIKRPVPFSAQCWFSLKPKHQL